MQNIERYNYFFRINIESLMIIHQAFLKQSAKSTIQNTH